VGALQAAEDFIERAHLAVVFDHARAGNMFFLTLFDQHEEVLCSPALHYIYSYFYAAFAEEDLLDARAAHRFATETSYFKYLYPPENRENQWFLTRHGVAPDIELDRSVVRETFDELILSQETVSRRRVIAALYAAYALGTGRNLNNFKYVLVSDAISLRTETVFAPFSASVVDLMLNDFEEPKLVHLVRDPRASYASFNQEYTNELGNTYGLTAFNPISQFRNLITLKQNDRKGCVFLMTMAYFVSGSKTMNRLKTRLASLFKTVRNEDLNLEFETTIRDLVEWLGVRAHEGWFEPDYAPTSIGRTFLGVGAYHKSYVQNQGGPLKHDPLGVSRKVTGPNKYVTERWKERLCEREKAMLECVFFDDLVHYNYPFHYINETSGPRSSTFLWGSLLPMTGEIPGVRWLFAGGDRPIRWFLDRLLYYVYLIPFYVTSRVILARLYFTSFFSVEDYPDDGTGGK